MSTRLRMWALAAMSAALVTTVPAVSARASSQSQQLAESASQLESQIVSTGHQLHQMAVAVAAAQAHLAASQSAEQSDQHILVQLQTQLAQATTELRSIALNAYIRSGEGQQLQLFSGSPTDAAASAVYDGIATASESAGIDSWRKEAAAVAQSEAQLAAQRAASLAEYDALSRQYAQLQAQAANENSLLAAVRTKQARLAAGPPAGVDLANLAGGSSMAEDFYRLRVCESNDNYQDNTGNGYYGAYQFAMSTWEGLGYSGLPSDAPPATQDAAAIRLQQKDGWGAWPGCSAMLGLD